MTDLYSVLRNSIRRGDLHDSAQRERIYGHARDVMIKKLWAFRPPLSPEEIEEKLHAFDLAIGRIEDEVSFHLQNAARLARPALIGHVAVAEPQYEMAAAPRAASAGAAAAPVERPQPRREKERRKKRIEWSESAEQISATQISVRRRVHSGRNGENVAIPAPAEKPRRPREPQPDAYSDRHAYDEPRRQQGNGRAAGRRQNGHHEADDAPTLEPVYGHEPDDDVYPDQRAFADLGERPHWRSGIGRFVVLGAVAFGIAALIWTLTIFYTVFFPSSDSTQIATGGPAGAGTAVAATAADFPRLERVTSTISVFDGRDPTVFEGTTDNPIRFSGDAEGGFARVNSSSGSPGARAVIGPGLMQRIAGKQVRVVVTARSSQENGALSSRFAFQSGTSLTPWTSVILSERFAPVEINWTVPKIGAGNPNANFLVVQPGVPGDGTGIDIRSIRIDVLS